MDEELANDTRASMSWDPAGRMAELTDFNSLDQVISKFGYTPILFPGAGVA